MASDVINLLTRNLLSEITKKELLQKVLEQKESDGKNVEISNNSFEKFVKNVLISQYNLEPPLSEKSQEKLDTFAANFRHTVRRHADSLKKLKLPTFKKVQRILEKNENYYGIKIQKTELQVIPNVIRRRKRKPGTSRPENLQTPLAKRISFR